jgi:hypothetical protein
MTSPRNRVTGMELIRAGDLLEHDGNWRVHPLYQKRALDGRLSQTGITDALKAYRSARNGGKLTLVDGHLRKAADPDTVWPVLVLDLDDDEADEELAFHDTIGAWAETNPLALQSLLDKARAANDEMTEARERAAAQIADQVAVAKRALGMEDAPPREANSYDTLRLAPMVKAAFAVGDDLDTVERAIRATGIQNRGAALGYICNHFIRLHGATPDEQEAPEAR